MLAGHKSIVNATLFHPHLLLMATSGVEKDIIMHSPTASSPCFNELERTETATRAPEDDFNDDSETIRLFDR